MTKLKELLSEFALRSYPDWNDIQLNIFKQLQAEQPLSYNEFVKVARALRNHMNDNYFSGTWNVDKSHEELQSELVRISKQALNQ